MTFSRILLAGLAFPEAPRWRDGRVYVSDWGAGEIHAVSPGGGPSTVVARGSAFPLCIDFLPDGRLVVVDGPTVATVDDGALEPYADLGALSPYPFNDTAVDDRGHLFVNNIGFAFPGEEPRPGFVAVVPPDGPVRRVAEDLLFPNGMAVIGRTLVVAESYGGRLTAFDIDDHGGLSGRRTWADLGDAAPDGICATEAGAIWYADVGAESCTLVAEGGEELDRVVLDRGAFSCTLADGVLYVATNAWEGGFDPSARNGQLVAVDLAQPRR